MSRLALPCSAATEIDRFASSGKVFSIFVGRKQAIVVCGYEAAAVLLEGEGGKTADRPRTVMAGETMSGNKRCAAPCCFVERD